MFFDRQALLNLSLGTRQSTPFSAFSTAFVVFTLLLAWDASALDLGAARLFGNLDGFSLESHWFWRGVLHEPMRNLGWVVEFALLAGIFRPFGALKKLPVERRLQLALSPLLALILVAEIKLHSRTSCPWDLQEFGGMATYVSHWALGMTDGGGGGCFPAGHASAGFAFFAGFFAFREVSPTTARRWLAGALVAGLLLGVAQQVRGAHYMSHTLWTGWLCWCSAAAIDAVVSQWIAQRPSRAPEPVRGYAESKPSTQSA